jgi:dienelactone hydrolase
MIVLATSLGMRSRVLTTFAVLALAVAQVACGADASSTPSSQDLAAAGQTPSQDLASGTGNSGGATGTMASTTSAPAATGTGAQTPGTGTGTSTPTTPAPTTGTPTPTPTPPPVDPNAGAGPKPTATCNVTKDSAGFFTRTSSASSYVAYVPASYTGTAPVRLIVGVHGCGDTAMNFATWGVNPYDTRSTQDHIGISIGGADGRCWTAADDAKVLAAVDDISSCFWVHQKKVVIAGFSSGGELSYRLGLSQASRFAGILIEDSGLYAANSNPDGLLANASWKLNIAHLTHTSDPVFPLATVKADWAKTTAAGFPLVTKETPGVHDGTSTDWATWLIPLSASWVAP